VLKLQKGGGETPDRLFEEERGRKKKGKGIELRIGNTQSSGGEKSLLIERAEDDRT